MGSHTPLVLSGAALRTLFLTYFKDTLGHKVLPSASLVPANPTVYLTPAGMLPFVPVFLGIEAPPNPPRVATVQKCARVSGKASDLSYVGRTPRHHTFFEMLGNFSFGDYFKHDIIPWAWAFVTQQLGLPTERLWVSVFKDDLESRDIWRDVVGVAEDRILFCDEKDNFWGPPGPSGPCGPCTEIHYLMGDGPAPTGPDLLEDPRVVEIWNLVFMELFQDVDGNRTPLEKKNVDTGMGLERLAMVVQNARNTFETDLLMPILQEVAKLTHTRYGQTAAVDVALKIVTDHVRFATFAIADGIVPGNEGRGYVLRMITRRALLYAKKYLGIQQPMLYQLVAVVRDNYQAAYPELNTQYNNTVNMLKQEEKRFFDTLERGQRLLETTLTDLKAIQGTVIAGDIAFKLYDTYGFPLELTQDLAEADGMTVDVPGFEAAMAQQKAMGRAHQKQTALVQDDRFTQLFTQLGATQFVGYNQLQAPAKVTALFVDGEQVDTVSGTNQPFQAILDATPFYAESGGQVGDRGTFIREEGHHGLTVVVNDTQKVGELVLHTCLFDNGGSLQVGQSLLATVDPTGRHLSAIHHSSTHLLQAALRKVLGQGVHQAGSRVSPEGARFDFTFNRPVTPEELARIEYWVNQWIRDNVSQELTVTHIDEAKAKGALMMADEKYGDTVRVVAFGSTSVELCGGTHVDSTGSIGLIKLLSETGIAAGVRRIEFVAGEAAYKAFKQQETQLRQVASGLKCAPAEVPSRVEKLAQQLKATEKQLQHLQDQQASQVVKQLLGQISPAGVLVQALPGTVTADRLRWMAEKLADHTPSRVLLLAGTTAEGTVAMVASVSDDWVAKGVKAGNLVKQVATQCGGGGGGKPGFAQAGGKQPDQLAPALAQVLQQLQG
jgi:alanyl-tRNA synthetase